jgi:hypothetical protein
MDWKVLLTLGIVVFIVGYATGYAVRAGISHRRRQRAS